MLKKLLIAAAGVLIAVPALADPGRDHDRPWGHWKRHYYGYARPVVVVPPPRVVYAPAPPVVYEPAVVYPAPMPQSGVSIRLHFPL